jgi:hypothetical protein
MKKLFLLLTLTACAKVSIKDAEWCGDMGFLGASCFHTLTPDTRDIPQPNWDEERFGQVCTKAKTFKDMKVAIEKLCSVSNVRCSYEVEEIIRNMDKNLANFERKLGDDTDAQ